MAVQKTNTQNLSSLIINKVDSKDTFQSMVTNNLVNANELYLVQSELGEDSEIFTVEFTQINDRVSPTATKTYSEIIDAIENGYSINAIYAYVPDNTKCNLLYYSYYEDENSNIIVFSSSLMSTPSGYGVNTISYDSYNNVYYNFEPINLSNATLTIGSYTYDGSSAVNIPVYDGTYTWG